MMSHLAAVAWIVAVWLIASESFTRQGVLAGVVVAVVVTRLFHLDDRDSEGIRFRPIAVCRLVAYFLIRLARANAQVALAVISPGRVRYRRAIVSVRVTDCSETIVWFLANAVSLTPGTSIVEVRSGPTVFYLHVLVLTSVAAVRLEVLEMQRRLLLAFGPDQAITEVERQIRELSIVQLKEGPRP
ncbi:MAG: Na+/H+ antiporter subunit E [Actinomycetota bacterium]